MASIDVVHALNLKPGDLYAGRLNTEAPTRPIHNFAAAWTLTSITPYTDDDGRRMLRLEAGGFTLTPIPIATQCLLIRGVS